MPTPSSPNPGSDMIRIHKAITRALELSLDECQGGGPQPALRQGFHAYVLSLHAALHAHHLAEDEVAFPYWQKIEPELPVDQLSISHRLIEPLLDRLQLWLESGDSAWEPVSMQHLQAVLAALVSLWHPHIALEEGYFSPQTCAHFLDPEENARLAGEIAAHSQQHTQPPELVVPFVLFNLSPEDRAAMVQVLPPVIMEQLVPYAWKAAWAPMQPFLLE